MAEMEWCIHVEVMRMKISAMIVELDQSDTPRIRLSVSSLLYCDFLLDFITQKSGIHMLSLQNFEVDAEGHQPYTMHNLLILVTWKSGKHMLLQDFEVDAEGHEPYPMLNCLSLSSGNCCLSRWF